MPHTSEEIDITGYPLIPLKKTADGKYVFPRERFGILPYYITPAGQIVWGCVESNRIEPVTIAPAAGTQDIIAIKNDQRLVLELGKPFPELNHEFLFLHHFRGIAFKDAAYQDIINCLITNGFNVYLENPLATAIHEAYEEHGIDLQQPAGHDSHLLRKPLELSQYELIPAQPGAAALGVWLPELTSFDKVVLRDTKKIDTKMRRNLGREFYEKGVWVSLEEFKTKSKQEKEKFALLDGYPPVKVELINETFSACDRHIQFLEQIEPLLIENLRPKLRDNIMAFSFFRALNPTSTNSGIVYCLTPSFPCQGTEMIDQTVAENFRDALDCDLSYFTGLYATYDILVGVHFDLDCKGLADSKGGKKGVLDYLIFPLIARKLIADSFLDEKKDRILTNIIAWTVAISLEVVRFTAAIALTLLLAPVVALVNLIRACLPKNDAKDHTYSAIRRERAFFDAFEWTVGISLNVVGYCATIPLTLLFLPFIGVVWLSQPKDTAEDNTHSIQQST